MFGIIGIFIISTPLFIDAIQLSNRVQFSSIYLLGQNGILENLPYIVRIDQTYSLYLGVQNNRDSISYYSVHVKLRNQTDLLTDVTGHDDSLQAIYEYYFALSPNKNWEAPFSFLINSVAKHDSTSFVDGISINDVDLIVNKQIVQNNLESFNLGFIFELWIFDSTTNTFQFDDRFINLNLSFQN